MKILIIGANGMLGHVVKLYMEEQGYDVYATSRRKDAELYFDAENDIKSVEKILEAVKPDAVINCIGVLNKDAEDNKRRAVLINSYLPHYLDSLQEKYGFKFVHISTDCVFEGTKGDYDEEAFPDALSFYGRTKALGEVINEKSVTLRTSIVGPDVNEKGIGLFQWFMNQSGSVGGYTKVIWTGVTTVELAKAIEKAIVNDLSGLHHVVNNQTISKYDLLMLFKKHLNKQIDIVENPNVESKKTLVRTSQSFDFGVPSYDDMILEMKNWILAHEELYGDIFDKCEVKGKNI